MGFCVLSAVCCLSTFYWSSHHVCDMSNLTLVLQLFEYIACFTLIYLYWITFRLNVVVDFFFFSIFSVVIASQPNDTANIVAPFLIGVNYANKCLIESANLNHMPFSFIYNNRVQSLPTFRSHFFFLWICKTQKCSFARGVSFVHRTRG